MNAEAIVLGKKRKFVILIAVTLDVGEWGAMCFVVKQHA